MLLFPATSKATKQSSKDGIHAPESFAAFARTVPNLSIYWSQLPSCSDVSVGPDRTDKLRTKSILAGRCVRRVDFLCRWNVRGRKTAGFRSDERPALFGFLRRKLGFRNVNTIRMEKPILHLFGFTQFDLLQFSGMPPI